MATAPLSASQMRQLQSQLFTSVCQDLRRAGVSIEEEDLEERYVR